MKFRREYRPIVETQFIGDGDEIPRWNTDRLWKHNLLAMKMKFQGEIETDCGNTIY